MLRRDSELSAGFEVIDRKSIPAALIKESRLRPREVELARRPGGDQERQHRRPDQVPALRPRQGQQAGALAGLPRRGSAQGRAQVHERGDQVLHGHAGRVRLAHRVRAHASQPRGEQERVHHGDGRRQRRGHHQQPLAQHLAVDRPRWAGHLHQLREAQPRSVDEQRRRADAHQQAAGPQPRRRHEPAGRRHRGHAVEGRQQRDLPHRHRWRHQVAAHQQRRDRRLAVVEPGAATSSRSCRTGPAARRSSA